MVKKTILEKVARFSLAIVDLPIQMFIGFLRGLSEVIELFFQSLGGVSNRPVWLTIVMLPILLPYWIGLTVYNVLSYPLSLGNLDPERRVNLYWGIPAIVAMSVVFFIGIQSLSSNRAIDERYRAAMQRALMAGDFKLATILGGRLVSGRTESDQKTRLAYALALRQANEITRSDAILAGLAPSDKPGYAPAHRVRAMSFASMLQKASSDSVLEQLRWHLQNSGGDPNAAIEKLWTAYFVTVGQPEEAVPHMELAAKIEPAMLIMLANLYQEIKNKPGETRSLQRAEAQFLRRIKDNPLARDDRLQLVLAQTRLDKTDAAEETILKGVQLHNDAKIRRSAAQFYVLRYDVVSKSDSADLKKQFEFLEKALAQDLFFADIYERLIELYQKSESNEEAVKTQELLESMLADGSSPALTHFALSSIYKIQGNDKRAENHLFQAYRLDDKYPLITNNLAWMLAHRDQPDLAKAYELVINALRTSPTEARFRDTLATILMKQGRYYEAIAEFESILERATDKISIHRKLAELYANVKEHSLAQKHAERANEMTKNAGEKKGK